MGLNELYLLSFIRFKIDIQWQKFVRLQKANTSLHQAIFMGNGFKWAWLGYCLTQLFSGFHFLGPYQWTDDCNWEGSEFIWLWCFSDMLFHCSPSYGSSRAVLILWCTHRSGSGSTVLSSLACCASAITRITFMISSFSWTQAQATPHWLWSGGLLWHSWA